MRNGDKNKTSYQSHGWMHYDQTLYGFRHRLINTCIVLTRANFPLKLSITVYLPIKVPYLPYTHNFYNIIFLKIVAYLNFPLCKSG